MTYNFETELTEMKEQWKERVDELHLLFSVAKQFAAARDVDLLLEQIVERAAQVLRAEASSLLLMNMGTMQLDFKVVKGQNSEAIRNLNLHLQPGEGLAGWVAANNRPVIANDARSDKRFAPEIDRLIGFRTRNILAVPLGGESGTIGVIEVLNRLDGQDFTQHDAEFLSSVAWLAARALENAQTQAALQQSAEYLAALLENLPGGFIAADAERRITHCNARAMEILGLPRSIVGQTYSQALALQPDAVQALDRAFAEASGQKRQAFFSAATPWRVRRHIGFSTLTIPGPGGRPRGVGLLFQDITEFTD